MKATTMQSEILRELEYMCDVAGLPVARYVYSLAQGKLQRDVAQSVSAAL